MGISVMEFQVAMETFGATRLADRHGSRYSYFVPCFDVKGVNFLHSGSYYIVQRGQKAPEDVFNRAMAEFGEKHPGGEHFWWGETHSVKGILTLAAMLEDRYSKELVDELTNETYKKLFACPLIQGNAKMPFHELPSPSMEALRKVLAQYDDVANPFGNSNVALKEPIEYLGKVNASLFASDVSAGLKLNSKNSGTAFYNNEQGLSYQTNGRNNAKQGAKSGYTVMGHYYNNGSDGRPVDEVVYLDHTTGDGYGERPGDIDLRISLKTGLAWKTYHEEQAEPATDEQLATMIAHLKKSITRVKRTIVGKMIIRK